MKFLPFLIITLLSFQTVHASGDENIEAGIILSVSMDLPRALKNLEQAVNINSGTMNFNGVKKVGALFKSQLEELEFNVEWVDGSDFGRAGHLVASYGNKGPKILMIGHLDTVFAKGDDFQTFTPIDETHIAGPGITDMKGGDIIIISAMRALKKMGVLDDVSIRIVMTGDEESSGRPLSKSKKALIDAAIWADIALGFEDGDSDIRTAVIARRGSVNWTLDVTGKPAHSSQIFRQDIGYGAIFEAARILNSFRKTLSNEKFLTFNPGIIIGGTRINYDKNTDTGDAFGKTNVIAKTLQVKGGIRALSIENLVIVQDKMQTIVADNLAHTSATLVFEEGYPPLAPTEGNKKLLEMYSNVSQDLGYGDVIAVDPKRAGAADISFTAGHVDMALDGLGLMGDGGHTKDEVADITSLEKNTAKAAILIYRLSQ